MSFRLDKDILETIRSESERQGVSLNVFANKIFRRYVEWDMFEQKVGMVPVARPILEAVFDRLQEDEVMDIAKKVGKSIVRDIAEFMKGSVTVESFLSWFETRMNSSGFEMNHQVEGSKHTYIVKHDLGNNWSLYHKTVLELVFHDVLQKPIKIETNNRMMKFTVTI